MADIPSLTSGRRGIKDPVVENLNAILSAGVYQQYLFIKHGFKVPARLTKHDIENEGVNLGFDVRSQGPEEGPLDLQLSKATDLIPLGAHILKITIGSSIKYYGCTDSNYPKERNAVVRGNNSCLEMINPFFQNLLSYDLGDSLQLTYSIATMASTEALDTAPKNHRTGSTKAYAATQADGSALPPGVTIAPSTGIISSVKATVVAGDYEIKVTASDVITTLPANHPYRTLECEQTLFLKITA